MSNPDLALTTRVALRHFKDGDTTDAERDAMLSAAIKTLPDVESETAGRILFHRRAAETQLDSLINAKPPAA